MGISLHLACTWPCSLSVRPSLLQGVGRATAELFAKNGYNVVIAARNPQKLSEAMEQLSRRCAPGRACLGISTDITKGDAVDDLVAQVTDKCESVDILINCAGSP